LAVIEAVFPGKRMRGKGEQVRIAENTHPAAKIDEIHQGDCARRMSGPWWQDNCFIQRHVASYVTFAPLSARSARSTERWQRASSSQ
jgi:hypothetical protein